MKLIYYCLTIIFAINPIVSKGQSENEGQKNMTMIDLINLPLSGELNSGNKKLETITSSPLVVKLSGLNQLKYKYILNHELVSMYNEGGFSLTNLIKDNTSAGNQDTGMLENRKERDSLISEKSKLNNLKSNKALNESAYDSLNLILDSQINELTNVIEQQVVERRSIIKGVFKAYSDVANSLGIKEISPNVYDSNLDNLVNTYKIIVYKSESLKKEIDSEILIASSRDYLNLSDLIRDAEYVFTELEMLVRYYNEVSIEFESLENEEIIELKKSVLKNAQSIGESYTRVKSLQDSVQTPPIDLHGENVDYLNVTLELIPLDENKNPVNSVKEYSYKIWAKGGFKIDFSAGIFLSTLRDKTFLTTKVESPENGGANLYNILEEDQGNFEYGIGSTVNFTYRSSKFINLGGSVGGYITSNQKFRLVVGPTIVLGKMERVIFGGGFVFGEITELSKKVNLNETFDLGSDGTVPTVQKFDFGYFLSFTYNLSKAKRSEE